MITVYRHSLIIFVYDKTDNLIAFMIDRNLPVDEIELSNIADEVLQTPPVQGFLTISNALQWRLQYGRVIESAGQQEGIIAVYRANL